MNEVDLRVESGELVGLIGPNGAGKTTFIDAITGFVPPRGTVDVRRRATSPTLRPHRRARAGLARTWQSLELFDDLTVEENLHVAAERPTLVVDARPTWCAAARCPTRRRRLGALDLLGIADAAADRSRPSCRSASASWSASRARSPPRPRCVLLDEPAAGLDTDESVELGAAIRARRRRRHRVLLVDHDMGLVLGVCDRVYVLDFGS